MAGAAAGVAIMPRLHEKPDMSRSDSEDALEPTLASFALLAAADDGRKRCLEWFETRGAV